MADDEANVVFDEVPVSSRVFSAQQGTPEELVALGLKIWREDVKPSKPEGDAAAADLLARLQEKHADFNHTFPLVLRWMVQLRVFKPKAFKRYLLKHAATSVSSREEFLRLQAEYPVFVFRETHAHPSEDDVRRYRDELVAQLLEEDKTFVELQKKALAEVEAQDLANDADRRRRLVEFLRASCAGAASGPPASS